MIAVKKKMDAAKLNKIAEVLKTVSHPLRLSVIEQLDLHDRLTVSEIMEKLNSEQSLLSHHLTKMKDRGVLFAEREGKNIYYRLADKKLTRIFECMENCDFIR